ncbi:hypothetical protein TG4357_03320 [Thalassovita gelatinovora]|uniref:Mu-like prophage FluMu N-terminal domain-containing protein n=1 Tax=Thalassovita gelatinovora TaxID=53501 RepID=A0A0P1FJ25_THAGE|nr:HI1506-related protein [Thalassovita gelatinovora]QIZ81565.1 hypothetical protein HFZ77_14295 [Thalassovita gelatinovora]CUH67981.1 hypothetical protein TG4357_03320 [Thalassovita gelatinovora]SEQ26761.1 hypothetical protein SAMN04488043_104191 [Thalassovita gelatinovora]
MTDPNNTQTAPDTTQATTADKPKAPVKPKSATKPKAPAKDKVEVIEVVGPAAGFRRAGHTFGKDPVRIPIGDLSKAQLALIEGEPKLISARKEIEA